MIAPVYLLKKAWSKMHYFLYDTMATSLSYHQEVDQLLPLSELCFYVSANRGVVRFGFRMAYRTGHFTVKSGV